MIGKLIASVTSFLFILLLSFPSLAMENNSRVWEELEKERIEHTDEIVIKKSDEILLRESVGFVVVVFPAVHSAIPYVTSSGNPCQQYLFLRYCSLLM
ncbi:MAG: hypothetical protein DI538_17345 [Azospira oryzae]|jgi:hypothetical protein|nr:MAG: hypothetical protein DI538_17345 [Azospira oryzae]